MQSLHTRLEVSSHLDLRPDLELQTKLDERFSKPFALAPSELRHKFQEGALSKREYREQNENFGMNVCHFLIEEIVLIVQELVHARHRHHHAKILHLGLGELHDLMYILPAMNKHLEIELVDASQVVCRRAKKRLNRILSWRNFGAVRHPQIHFADAEKYINGGSYDSAMTLLVHLSRILQFMPREKAQSTLKGLGRGLRAHRRIVIVHPFPEDNQNVTWGNTIPHQLGDLYGAIQDGAESTVRINRERKIPYFNQVYTALALQAM